MALGAILVLGLTACEKDEPADDLALIQEIAFAADRTDISPAELPAEAQYILEEQFFETYPETVYAVAGRGYCAELGNDEVLYFNQRGALLEFVGEHDRRGPFGQRHPHGPCHHLFRRFGHIVPVDSLPPAIQTYVTDNYPDSEIVRAKVRDETVYIMVDRHTVLTFDLEGNFLEEVSPLASCNRPCRELGEDEAATAVEDYIAANFPDAEVKRTCRRIATIHVLLLTDEGRIILVFDSTGTFLFQRP